MKKIKIRFSHKIWKISTLIKPTQPNGTLAEQGNEIIRATLSGNIPPDIGAQLITALANQGKLIELQELTERIEILEEQKKWAY